MVIFVFFMEMLQLSQDRECVPSEQVLQPEANQIEEEMLFKVPLFVLKILKRFTFCSIVCLCLF